MARRSDKGGVRALRRRRCKAGWTTGESAMKGWTKRASASSRQRGGTKAVCVQSNVERRRTTAEG
eukprot:3859837-Pleurochrysis_carterae.AAC.7